MGSAPLSVWQALHRRVESAPRARVTSPAWLGWVNRRLLARGPPRRAPLHGLFDGPVVTDRAIGGPGPERPAGILRPGMTAEAARKEGAVLPVIEPILERARPGAAGAADNGQGQGQEPQGSEPHRDPARDRARSAGGRGTASVVAAEEQRHAGVEPGLVPVERRGVGTIPVFACSVRLRVAIRSRSVGLHSASRPTASTDASSNRNSSGSVEGRPVGGEGKRRDRKEGDGALEPVRGSAGTVFLAIAGIEGPCRRSGCR